MEEQFGQCQGVSLKETEEAVPGAGKCGNSWRGEAMQAMRVQILRERQRGKAEESVFDFAFFFFIGRRFFLRLGDFGFIV